MSESSNTQPAGDEPFGAEQFAAFARDTVRSIEFGDAIAGLLEDRVTRIEQCVAAPWYRRRLLWARLRRDIRASVAPFPDTYIPRGDFPGRRWEWAAYTATLRYDRQGWKPEFGEVGQADETAQEQPPAEGGADPGEGFLS